MSTKAEVHVITQGKQFAVHIHDHETLDAVGRFALELLKMRVMGTTSQQGVGSHDDLVKDTVDLANKMWDELRLKGHVIDVPPVKEIFGANNLADARIHRAS